MHSTTTSAQQVALVQQSIPKDIFKEAKDKLTLLREALNKRKEKVSKMSNAARWWDIMFPSIFVHPIITLKRDDFNGEVTKYLDLRIKIAKILSGDGISNAKKIKGLKDVRQEVELFIKDEANPTVKNTWSESIKELHSSASQMLQEIVGTALSIGVLFDVACELDDTEKKLGGKEVELNDKEVELNDTKVELEEQKEETKKEKERADKAEQAMQNVEDRFSRLEDNLDDLSSVNKKLIDKLIDTKTKFKTKECLTDQKIASTEQKCQTLEEENKQLNTKYQTLEKEVSEMKSMFTMFMAANKNNTQLNNSSGFSSSLDDIEVEGMKVQRGHSL